MYLALYRKYRPGTFDDVISQEHITTTLKNQIKTGQIAHAYLFTGTRGTGKTSCAKIMAKAVNCLSPKEGNPCGECEACKAIADGSTDIIEIDAASNNGVDSIRQIRDEVVYTPIDCKYKVYIIDEVHMLTGAAFNALLKTLEEPPAHVIFILATTEYYKVPATILSRCQQFLFSKIDAEQSAKRLLEIAEKESVTLTPEGAQLIARLSDGAMRDALSLLDQCVSVGGTIDEECVRQCSGAADSSYLFTVSEAAIEQSPPKALKLLDDLSGQGKDFSRFIEELTTHYRNLMLIKSAGEEFVKATPESIAQYKAQCRDYSLEEIMRHIDLISDSLDSINRMKQTGQARLLTEQLLIRLTTPKLTSDVSAFAARLGAVENKLNNIVKGDIALTVQPEAEKTAVKEKEEILQTEKTAETSPEKPKAPQEEKPIEIPQEKAEEKSPVIEEFDPSLPTEPPPLEYFQAMDFEEIPPPVSENLPLTVKEEKIRNRTDKSEEKTEISSGKTEIPPKKAGKSVKVTSKAKSEGIITAIGETDFELPTGTAALPQWQDIVACLPASSRGIVSQSEAYLYGGALYVKASTSAAIQLKRAAVGEKLRDAVTTVMGGRFDIYMLKEKPKTEKEDADHVTPFLNKAKSMGISVTVNTQ